MKIKNILPTLGMVTALYAAIGANAQSTNGSVQDASNNDPMQVASTNAPVQDMSTNAPVQAPETVASIDEKVAKAFGRIGLKTTPVAASDSYGRSQPRFEGQPLDYTARNNSSTSPIRVNFTYDASTGIVESHGLTNSLDGITLNTAKAMTRIATFENNVLTTAGNAIRSGSVTYNQNVNSNLVTYTIKSGERSLAVLTLDPVNNTVTGKIGNNSYTSNHAVDSGNALRPDNRTYIEIRKGLVEATTTAGDSYRQNQQRKKGPQITRSQTTPTTYKP